MPIEIEGREIAWHRLSQVSNQSCLTDEIFIVHDIKTNTKSLTKTVVEVNDMSDLFKLLNIELDAQVDRFNFKECKSVKSK